MEMRQFKYLDSETLRVDFPGNLFTRKTGRQFVGMGREMELNNTEFSK